MQYDSVRSSNQLKKGDGSVLILRRKKGESIDIAEKITVTVVRVSGNKVQIGIDAPKEVEVHREEITKLIKAKKQAGYIRKLKQPPTPQ